MTLILVAVASGVLVGLAAGYGLARRDIKRRLPYPLDMNEATRDGLTKCVACAGAGWYRLTGGMG